MLAGDPPVRVHSQQLCEQHNRPDLQPGGPAQGCRACTLLSTSLCGHFIAARVQGSQYVGAKVVIRPGKVADSNLHAPRLPGRPNGSIPAVGTSEVHVYSITEGFERLATFRTGPRAPTTKWSPSSHLCVAQLCSPSQHLWWDLDSRRQESSICSIAFSWDPKTRTILHTLEPEVSAILRKLADGCKVFSCWAPSCRHLLLHGFQPRRCRHSGKYPGWLVIVDVVAGKLAAQSSLHSTITCEPPVSDVAWHPSSAGLVIHADIEVQDTAALRHAGFAVGVLPARLRLHAAGFSSDARLLLATGLQGVVLVSCRVDGRDMCLKEIRNLRALVGSGTMEVIAWLPGSATLFLHASTPATLQCCLVEYGGAEEPSPLAWHSLCNGRVSPSGRLYFPSPHSVHVIEVQTRLHRWDEFGYNPLMPRALQEDLPAQLQLPQRTLCCAAWLPSGLGMLLSTSGELTPEGHKPPALHLVWFA